MQRSLPVVRLDISVTSHSPTRQEGFDVYSNYVETTKLDVDVRMLVTMTTVRKSSAGV